MNFDIIVEDALNNKIKDRTQFQSNIKAIASMVKAQDNNKEFKIRNDPQILVDQYKENYSHLSGQLTEILEKSQQVLQKAPKVLKSPKKKKAKISQDKEDTVFGGLFGDSDSGSDYSSNQGISEEIKPLKQQKYTFSTLLKGKSILVEKNGLVAKQTSSGSSTRFVLVNEGYGAKNQKITFKVVRLVNWVGFGIAIKSIITAAGYNFNYNTLGHGSYLLSTNGYTWSHSEQSDNIVSKSFAVKEGETVTVILSEKELSFKNNSNNKTLTIKINIKPQEWASVGFCANLCSAEDKVEIVN